jgi:glyoxylase-like metal-dependent hydrolase (beta-lactamase superfamily II)
MRIIRIPLPYSNAYLIIDQRAILVDAGFPGDTDRILRAITQAGITPRDISLLVHTHGHIDHAGTTAELTRRLGMPTMIHQADAHNLITGTNGIVTPRNFEARLVAAMLVRPFDPVTPDIILSAETSLHAYGVDGHVIFTPGHTKGSLSLILGNGEAIVGDVMMGGWFGGTIRPRHPNYHYFVDDWDDVNRSITRLLALAPSRWYVGHGGPLAYTHVDRAFAQPRTR